MISFHPVAYSPPSGLSSLNDAIGTLETGAIPTITGINCTVNSNSLIKVGRCVYGTLSVTATNITANTWTNLLRISTPPNAQFQYLFVRNSNATFGGVVRFSTDGMVHIFSNTAMSSNEVTFVVAYRTN